MIPDARDAIAESIAASTLLGRAATLEDVANVAAFVASDRGRTMTGATANISCGTLLD
jgi:3-oxoacyl-[acyl-carrier protein] reductase